MAVQAWFSDDDVEIDPGDRVTLSLSIQNLGDTTETYTIVPSGLHADWVTVGRGNLSLFGGSADVVEVVVAPPKLPTTTAGPTVVGVRILSAGAPDDPIAAEATIDVRAFDDRRIVPLSPVARGRRRADYEFMVENHGNGLASCRVRLIDPSERVDGSFDPPAVGVPPGGSSLVRLKAKAKRGAFRRAARTLDFDVEAEQPNHAPTAATLTLVQPKTVPTELLGRVLAVALLVGAAALAWFAVVRPTVEDAAQERVDERLSEFDEFRRQIAEEAGADAPVDTVAPEEPNPFVEPGEPFFARLAAAPAAEASADDAVSVPEGSVLDVTDVRVENSGGDTGTATLAVNGEAIYVWSLANVRGSLFEPNITEKRLQPGDNVTLSVACRAPGDQAVGTCRTAVNLGGRLVPLDDL